MLEFVALRSPLEKQIEGRQIRCVRKGGMKKKFGIIRDIWEDTESRARNTQVERRQLGV